MALWGPGVSIIAHWFSCLLELESVASYTRSTVERTHCAMCILQFKFYVLAQYSTVQAYVSLRSERIFANIRREREGKRAVT